MVDALNQGSWAGDQGTAAAQGGDSSAGSVLWRGRRVDVQAGQGSATGSRARHR